jgi:DNA-binding NarL/FixJ family response regulator
MTARPLFSEQAALRQGPLKILIADAHPLMRDGLASVLPELAPRVDVLQADSLQGAIASLAAHPDTALALLELILPDGEGTSVLERIREAHPGIPVVVVSGAADHATVKAALRAGAKGFVSKRAAPPVLLGALRLVLAGETYVPPEVLRTELQTPPRGTPSAAAATAPEHVRRAKLDLTKRQLEVLALLIQGKPNKVICRELGLAEGTVKAHTAAIFRALHVSNRTEAGFAVNCLGIEIPAAGGSLCGEALPTAPRAQLIPA